MNGLTTSLLKTILKRKYNKKKFIISPINYHLFFSFYMEIVAFSLQNVEAHGSLL